MPPRIDSQSAWTLIEVLVVVVIVGVLAALVVTSLRSAQNSAKAARSAGNLKQIGAACMTYAAENNNNQVPYFLRYGGNPGGMWYDHINEYLGRARGQSGRNAEGDWKQGMPMELHPVLLCPMTGDPYAINFICGWSLKPAEEVSGGLYVKSGMARYGSGPSYFPPGGPSRTAWFTTANGNTFEQKFQNNPDHERSLTYPDDGKTQVLFMDGSVRMLRDPTAGDEENDFPDSEEWDIFFGTPP